MRDHAADRSIENFRGRTVMEGAGFFRVDDVPFMEEIMVSELLVSRARQTRRHKSEHSDAEGRRIDK